MENFEAVEVQSVVTVSASRANDSVDDPLGLSLSAVVVNYNAGADRRLRPPDATAMQRGGGGRQRIFRHEPSSRQTNGN